VSGISAAGNNTAPNQEQGVLEELKEQYRQSLSEKSHNIRELVKALRNGDPNAATEIRRIAHTLLCCSACSYCCCA
jgi:mevalonate kinase